MIVMNTVNSNKHSEKFTDRNNELREHITGYGRYENVTGEVTRGVTGGKYLVKWYISPGYTKEYYMYPNELRVISPPSPPHDGGKKKRKVRKLRKSRKVRKSRKIRKSRRRARR